MALTKPIDMTVAALDDWISIVAAAPIRTPMILLLETLASSFFSLSELAASRLLDMISHPVRKMPIPARR